MAEPVKPFETRVHDFFCALLVMVGLLIQAMVGSLGGVGRRYTVWRRMSGPLVVRYPPMSRMLKAPSQMMCLPGERTGAFQPTPTVGRVEGIKSFSGAALRRDRITTGLSHDTLGLRIGRSRRQLIHWEQGRLPTPATLVLLAQAQTGGCWAFVPLGDPYRRSLWEKTSTRRSRASPNDVVDPPASDRSSSTLPFI